MYEFHYAFQLSKKRVFEVSYYTLGSNENPYFSTSAEEFNQPKTDYTICGQCQAEICTGKALEFYEKWDYMHLKKFDDDSKFRELLDDIEELKDRYNYIESIAEFQPRSLSFERIKELSKQEPKK